MKEALSLASEWLTFGPVGVFSGDSHGHTTFSAFCRMHPRCHHLVAATPGRCGPDWVLGASSSALASIQMLEPAIDWTTWSAPLRVRGVTKTARDLQVMNAFQRRLPAVSGQGFGTAVGMHDDTFLSMCRYKLAASAIRHCEPLIFYGLCSKPSKSPKLLTIGRMNPRRHTR